MHCPSKSFSLFSRVTRFLKGKTVLSCGFLKTCILTPPNLDHRNAMVCLEGCVKKSIVLKIHCTSNKIFYYPLLFDRPMEPREREPFKPQSCNSNEEASIWLWPWIAHRFSNGLLGGWCRLATCRTSRGVNPCVLVYSQSCKCLHDSDVTF